jgi:hypothetical protein
LKVNLDIDLIRAPKWKNTKGMTARAVAMKANRVIAHVDYKYQLLKRDLSRPSSTHRVPKPMNHGRCEQWESTSNDGPHEGIRSNGGISERSIH